MDIGRNIRKIRETKDFSQEFMARKLNISQPTYSLIEQGNKVTFERLKDISKIFNLTISEVISYDEENLFNDNNSNKLMDGDNSYKILEYQLIKITEQNKLLIEIINKLI